MGKVDLSVIGIQSEPIVFEYTWRDVVLYALGVGATAEELSLVYENAPGGLKVLPSFCVVPAVRAFPYFGEDIEWSLMLHGEHSIQLSRPIPPEGKLVQTGVITDIFDKGKGEGFQVYPEKTEYEKKAVGRTASVQMEEINDGLYDHVANMLECMKTRNRPASDIEIGHRTSSACLLGNVALRTKERIEWDPATQRLIRASAAAQKLLDREYRAPWKLTV